MAKAKRKARARYNRNHAKEDAACKGQAESNGKVPIDEGAAPKKDTSHVEEWPNLS